MRSDKYWGQIYSPAGYCKDLGFSPRGQANPLEGFKQRSDFKNPGCLLSINSRGPVRSHCNNPGER